MAQCTAVIDIGSNSMRMAVFQKTSRFAFHILHEVKSSVRLSENAYKNGGYLQMRRWSVPPARSESFYRSPVIRCPKNPLRRHLRPQRRPQCLIFLSRIKREHHLSIKVIRERKRPI
jgi:exopolyphosphatase / guanosine-5'-triphosphate,3'-diphosphate pyrophosphatase